MTRTLFINITLAGAIGIFLRIPADAASITWIGNQSSGHQSEDGSSFFDANYWRNYVVPGAADSVVFDDSQLIPIEGGPNVFFGDFTRHIYPPGATNFEATFFPGGDAHAEHVFVDRGGFSFDLGGHRLDIVRSTDIGYGLSVGTLTPYPARLTIRGSGTLHSTNIQVGGNAFTDGTIVLTGNGTTLDCTGVFLVGTGYTNAQGHMTGTVIVEDGAKVVSHPRNDGGERIAIGGTVDSSGSLIIRTGGSVVNSKEIYVTGHGLMSVASGGQAAVPNWYICGGCGADLNGSAIATIKDSGSKVNATNVRITSRSSLSVQNAGELITSNGFVAGSLSLDNGLISATNSLLIQRGGILRGNGLIRGNVFNSGVVAPGMSPGVIHIDGNYTQDSGGVLELEIGATSGPAAVPGVDYDVLDVTGALTLSGTVKISLLNGYVPNLNEHIDLINFGSFSGTAPTIQVVGAPSGFQYSTSLTGGRFGFDVVTVPEPETCVLVLLTAAAAARIRRRPVTANAFFHS